MREIPYELDTRVTRAVFSAVDDVNQMLPEEYWLTKGDGTPILGPTAVLDSMGFVNLIAAVEERIKTEFGISFSFLGTQAMMQRDAFTTLGTLTAYITRVLLPSLNQPPE